MGNRLSLLVRAARLLLQGRVRRRHGLLGRVRAPDGESYAAFRRVTVTPAAGEPTRPGARFRVRFRFRGLSATVNRILSLLPVPLIVAQPGFRSKTWWRGLETGTFVGAYEFSSLKEAEAYRDSLPLRLMRRRAAPGTLRQVLRPAAPPNSHSLRTRSGGRTRGGGAGNG